MKSVVILLLGICVILNPACGQSSGDYFDSFDGVKIYYEVKGDGYPLLLVHGFTSDGESWKRGKLYDDLLREGYKVITLDMRGNGKSDKPHDLEAYKDDAEAKDIVLLMNRLHITSYHAVGYSRGSIIVSRLLVRDSRIRRAVLGGMGADFMNPEWPRRLMFYRALSNEPVEELQGMIKRIKDNGLDQEALACLQGAQPHTTAKEFSEVTQPVLVICGDEDKDNGSSEELASVIPHATHVTVAGNHGGVPRTQAFSDAILTFLKAQ